MHYITIKKLLFTLLLFSNTQIYGTNVSTIHNTKPDKNNGRAKAEQILDAFYEQSREPKKKEFRQHLLKGLGYDTKREKRNEITKKARIAAYKKNIWKEVVSKEDKEFIYEDKALGKQLQEIEQEVEQEVVRNFPYSGRKGHEYDINKKLKKEAEDRVAETEDKIAETEDKIAKTEDKIAKTEDKIAEMEHKLKSWERKEKRKEKRREKRKEKRKEKIKEEKELKKKNSSPSQQEEQQTPNYSSINNSINNSSNTSRTNRSSSVFYSFYTGVAYCAKTPLSYCYTPLSYCCKKFL